MEIVAVEGDNKLAIVRIVSKWVFCYTIENFVGDAEFLNYEQIRVFGL